MVHGTRTHHHLTREITINLTPADNAPFAPELKVRFCEALAETGLVTVACRAVGKHRDTIYAHLRTDRVVLRRLRLARLPGPLSPGRPAAEDLIEGSVDHFYRDGVLVGERRFTDNRLAYAMCGASTRSRKGRASPPATAVASSTRSSRSRPCRPARKRTFAPRSR